MCYVVRPKKIFFCNGLQSFKALFNFHWPILSNLGFLYDSAGKESPCNIGDKGDSGLIPGLGRSPAKRNGNPLQYSCLKNPVDRGALQATVHGVTKSRIQLSMSTIMQFTEGGRLWDLILSSQFAISKKYLILICESLVQSFPVHYRILEENRSSDHGRI